MRASRMSFHASMIRADILGASLSRFVGSAFASGISGPPRCSLALRPANLQTTLRRLLALPGQTHIGGRDAFIRQYDQDGQCRRCGLQPAAPVLALERSKEEAGGTLRLHPEGTENESKTSDAKNLKNTSTSLHRNKRRTTFVPSTWTAMATSTC